MNISEFSALTRLSVHTLRYYEKLGLLSDIARNRSGHRLYRQKDADWVTFISRLKATGMPLQQILEYAQLRKAGDTTFPQRQRLLSEHRDRLQARISEELEHLQALENKIRYYDDHRPLTSS